MAKHRLLLSRKTLREELADRDQALVTAGRRIHTLHARCERATAMVDARTTALVAALTRAEQAERRVRELESLANWAKDANANAMSSRIGPRDTTDPADQPTVPIAVKTLRDALGVPAVTRVEPIPPARVTAVTHGVATVRDVHPARLPLSVLLLTEPSIRLTGGPHARRAS